MGRILLFIFFTVALGTFIKKLKLVDLKLATNSALTASDIKKMLWTP